MASDYSTASSSGLVDIAAGEWNEALIRELGFSLAQMPVLAAHNETVGRIAGPTGGANRASVAPALGDGVSASLACRGISPACANLGTSTAVRRIAGSLPAVADDVFWRFRFDRDCFVYGAISANGCAVIDWAQEVLAPQRNGSLPSTDTPLTADQSLPLFLPWVNGELFPYWSDSPRGILWGITAGLGAEALKIAVQQGVAFTVARMIEQVCSQSPEIGMVVVGGGVIILVTPCPEGVSVQHRSDIPRLGYGPYDTVRTAVEDGELTNLAVAAHLVHGGESMGRGVTVMLVSTGISEQEAKQLNFLHASTVADALTVARGIVGASADTVVLQHGGELLPEVTPETDRNV
ncbi:MAG: hypothetical protein EA384_11870 [Spirochaetaceae bacterium]|nr:MAG: hypothetical protein EA384_11870 [Spirochaetaceae bacterium]